jgi:hypothetical protein
MFRNHDPPAQSVERYLKKRWTIAGHLAGLSVDQFYFLLVFGIVSSLYKTILEFYLSESDL